MYTKADRSHSLHHIANRHPVACILQPNVNIQTGLDPRQVIIVSIAFNNSKLLLLLCALLVAAPAAAKTYYKWTDDSGTVHFSAEPPNNRDYETVTADGQVVGSSRAQTQSEAQQARQAAEDVQMPREAAPDPEVVAARCKQARENLFWLQSKRRIIVENEDGRDFIDAEEQQRLIEENQTLINEWCDQAR